MENKTYLSIPIAAKYAVSALFGLIIGILTVLGQAYFPDGINNLANSGAVWMTFAYLAAYFLYPQKRLHHILLAIAELLFCVLGYYGFEGIFNHHAMTANRWFWVWTVMAFVGGTVCGLAVDIGKTKTGIWQGIGKTLLPAVFLSEVLSKCLHFADYRHLVVSMVISAVIGIALYLLLTRKDWLKWQNFVCLAVLTVMGMAVYEVWYWM